MSFQSSNLTGGGAGDGGVLSVGAFGATPDAKGASIAGTVITMQPADATHPGELLAADWVTFNAKQASVLTTNGDVLYYNSGLQRLAKGSDTQVLTLASGLPSWATPSSGLDASLTTASYLFKGVDNTAGGAGAASDLTIAASAKTSGSGIGGTLVLTGGNSTGGSSGTVQLRIGGTAVGMNLVYAGGSGGWQATALGTSTNPSYSWVGATNSGMYFANSAGPAFATGGVVVLTTQAVAGESAIQLSAQGTMYSSANGGGLGYFGTTLVPFKNGYFGNGVVGIGVASGASSQYSANALLDVQSTTKGVLFPRMTTTQKNAVTASEGMIVYDLTLHKLAVYTGAAWETVTSI